MLEKKRMESDVYKKYSCGNREKCLNGKRQHVTLLFPQCTNYSITLLCTCGFRILVSYVEVFVTGHFLNYVSYLVLLDSRVPVN